MSVRQVIKSLTPPVLPALYRRLLGKGLRFSGRQPGWARAVELSTGYSTEEILGRVLAGSRAVVAGKARYERDSVLFDGSEYPFAVLATLLRAAAMNGGRIDVVDFGGSLGSTYRQCRPFLQGVGPIRWWVVEQQAFVAAGREFATDELQFVTSLAELPQLPPHSVVLACSVLPYLQDPRAIIAALSGLPARHLVIDRTPLCEQADHHLCVQSVPKEIYSASYPCWIFSHARLIAELSRYWSVVSDFACLEGRGTTDDGVAFEFRGLILEKSR